MYLIKGQIILADIETIEAGDGEDEEIIEANSFKNKLSIHNTTSEIAMYQIHKNSGV